METAAMDLQKFLFIIYNLSLGQKYPHVLCGGSHLSGDRQISKLTSEYIVSC